MYNSFPDLHKSGQTISKRTTRVISISILILCCLAFMGLLFWFIRAEQLKANKKIVQVCIYEEIIDRVKSRFDIKHAYCTWKSNYVMMLSFEVDDFEKAFVIAQEVFLIKQKSSFLSDETIEVKIKSGKPYNAGFLQIMIPGKNGYKGNRDYNYKLQDYLNKKGSQEALLRFNNLYGSFNPASP